MPSDISEKEWATYTFWEAHGFFSSRPQATKSPYVIVMPPPNITGHLHLGHVLNGSLQDVLARRARMQGREVCWVPGTDHASIATETKVVDLLAKRGIAKADLGRAGFLKEVWDWKAHYGGAIVALQKRLGFSADWDRQRFTMDEPLSQAVTKAFVSLYKEGYIYRDKRMIHWDPAGRTALSDEEVRHEEVNGHFYHIRYPLVGSKSFVVVATTRPETMLGDMALCVHPQDERYAHLHGKRAYVPLIGREIPIIVDDYVDPDFGSGCLKVTPAHDPNDYLLGKKHGLAFLNIFTEDGKLNEHAQRYVGEDRFMARKHIVAALKSSGLLVKTVPHTHQVGLSERTGAVVEPRLSLQWFVKMKDLAVPAIQAVERGDVRFHPHRFVNTYMSWMREIRDWCISRQLWWGHRIPVYYLSDGRYVVAETEEKALQAARQLTKNPHLTQDQLTQDPDVLDTWFSSWLWPLSVFEGTLAGDHPDFSYYYPTHDLVTGPDIIFFWVARMMMAGHKFTGTSPFRNVYFTGIVRDNQRRKMSKQLGNSPDVMELIATYGADGVRAGMLSSAPAGNDVVFDEKLCRQGKLFAHKIRNALRLVQSWVVIEPAPLDSIHRVAMAWFNARLQQVIGEVNVCFERFRISEAFHLVYQLIWNDFCARYLEMIKPRATKQLPKELYDATLGFFAQQLTLLHPFMPFVTEEVWQQLEERPLGASIMVAPYPVATSFSALLLAQANRAFALVSKIRQLRKDHTIPRGASMMLYVSGETPDWLLPFVPYVEKVTLTTVGSAPSKPPETMAFVVAETTCWITLPAASSAGSDQVALEKNLALKRKQLDKIMQKLGNDLFLKNAAPSIVAKERQKHQDVSRHIAMLEELLT